MFYWVWKGNDTVEYGKLAEKLHKQIMDNWNFPEEEKRNPMYLVKFKDKNLPKDSHYLNPNSPSDLEWWYEEDSEEMNIIHTHGFELLLMLENENITLKEAADKLIEYYLNQKKEKIKFSSISEQDQRESLDALID